MHNSLCPPPLFGPSFMMCPVNRACALTILPLSRPVDKILEYFAGLFHSFYSGHLALFAF